MTTTFTLLFVLLVLSNLALRLWLAARQIQAVRIHQQEVPADFREVISLEAHQKAARYTVDRVKTGQIGLLTETLVLLVLTLGGGIDTLSQQIATFTLPETLHGTLLLLSVLTLSALIDLPLGWYRQFKLEARYGFNRMTPRLFFLDTLKQGMLALLIGAPVLYVVLWLMQAMGEQWWWSVWLFWVSFNFLMLLLFPTVIAPLFNRFTPLAEGETKTRIEGLLQRCGFASQGLFVMDGSKRSNHGNAYFTGLGQSKRIVFFDTLLERLNPPQIEAVLAHELGHFKHRHILQRMVLMFGSAFLLLALLGWLLPQPLFFASLGVSTPSAAAGLLLFFMVVPLLTFPLSPLMNHLSREHEFEADRYATQHSSALALKAALLRLYEDNASTLTPDRLYSLFYDTHPPASLRLAQLTTTETPT